MIELDRAKQRFREVRFFSKYQATYALFLLQRYINKNGSFMSLSMLRQGVVVKVIVFPAGEKGEGWTGVSHSFKRLLFIPKKGKYDEPSNSMKNTHMGENSLQGRASYASVVKDLKGQPRKIGNFNANVIAAKERYVSGNEKTEYGLFVTNNNWYRVVVCIRERLWDEWCEIKKSLNEMFKINIVLHPFQPDKAAFCCKDIKEANILGHKGIVNIGEHFKVKLQGWNNGDLSIDKKVLCTGGWIEVIDLPLKWWSIEVFEEIGSMCGGLLQIDYRTKLMQHLFSAKIKVKGRESGFIPDEIDMAIGS